MEDEKYKVDDRISAFLFDDNATKKAKVTSEANYNPLNDGLNSSVSKPAAVGTSVDTKPRSGSVTRYSNIKEDELKKSLV
jgi:hypothetical protein